MHIKRHKGSLAEFNNDDLLDFSKILKVLLKKYDNLFGFSLPYIMVMHQNPTDGKKHPYYHWHLEFYPPYRTAKKLKYPAGCESGAGSFINDTLAEEKGEDHVTEKVLLCTG